MPINQDQPLHFHHSFDSILDTFMNIIASMTWLKVSVDYAKTFYNQYPYIIDLSCSVTPESIKVSKTIFNSIQQEGVNQATPLYSQTLINFYRVLTIAIKDIVWNEPDFQSCKQNQLLQFLRHIRNASAHNNEFFWGNGEQRRRTIRELPITWRGKVIKENLEHSKLYMDFMKPGDIFLLLSDISELV